MVVVTTDEEEDARRRMLQAVAVAILCKPCGADVLLEAIRRGLEKTQSP
jgi:DNA-binding NarL/FixJ family response regulator